MTSDPFEDVEASEALPEIQLNIQITEVRAEPRMLGRKEISAVDRLAALGEGKEDPGQWTKGGLQWSQEAADDLRGLW